MAYPKIHDSILDDEWFVTELTVTERYVWMALLIHSAKDRGCLTTDSVKMLARRIGAEVKDVDMLITKALAKKNLEYVPGGFVFTNYTKYDPDPTNAERQKRFRDKHRQKVTGVTTVTVTNANNTTEQNRTEQKKELQLLRATIVPIATNPPAFLVNLNQENPENPEQTPSMPEPPSANSAAPSFQTLNPEKKSRTPTHAVTAIVDALTKARASPFTRDPRTEREAATKRVCDHFNVVDLDEQMNVHKSIQKAVLLWPELWKERVQTAITSSLDQYEFLNQLKP